MHSLESVEWIYGDKRNYKCKFYIFLEKVKLKLKFSGNWFLDIECSIRSYFCIFTSTTEVWNL